MKTFSKLVMAAAVATMAAAPVAAAPANPAASLSVAKATRTGSTSANASDLAGGSGILIALAGGIAIIVAIIILGSEGSLAPQSP